MIKIDTAELTLEYTGHDHEVVRFESGAPETAPNEVVILDADTWKKMGYPHFMTWTGKVTKQ